MVVSFRLFCSKIAVPEEVVYYVVVCARNNWMYGADFLTTLKQYTNLVPPSESNLVRWASLPNKRFDAAVPSANPELWTQFRSQRWFDDEFLKQLWPVRSPDDLNIRRTRLNETLYAYERYYDDTELFYQRASHTVGLDLITMNNLLNAALFLEGRLDVFAYLFKIGALPGDVEWFTQRTKAVSDLLKRSIVVDFDKELAVEMACLTGYRNPPFPGFDVFTQARELAKSGNPHSYGDNATINNFSAFAEEAMDGVVSQVEWMTFDDYIKSGIWQTAGASTEGVVQWRSGDMSDSFKAKKNLAFAVCDIGSLCTNANNTDIQINKTFPKPELGKIRIAVSSDMYTYLQMSYLCYLTGDFDKTCSTIIGRESINEQTNRMLETSKELEGRWGFPFDADKYDHQPEKTEVKICTRADLSHALLNTPIEHVDNVTMLLNRVIRNFDNSHIITIRDGKTEDVLMTGGVASGWRITSRLGNSWSKTQYLRALRVLASFDLHVKARPHIKGDDMQFTLDTHAAALCLRWALAAVNLIGNDSKYGILPEHSELLRIAYYPGRCVGYICRAIPGILQRKPWSVDPMDPAAEIRAVHDVASILRRRGGNCRAIDTFVATADWCWSKLNHASQSWLSLPKSLGGLGVSPWRGTSCSSTHAPQLDFDSITITNITPTYHEFIAAKYSKYAPTSVEVSQLSQIYTRTMISNDDVPQIRRRLRSEFKLPQYTPTKIVFRWTFPALIRLRECAAYLAALKPTKDIIDIASEHFPPGRYGSYTHIHSDWLLASNIARLRGGSIMSHLIPTQPDFHTDLLSIERRGLTRHEALDYLFGTTSLAPLTRLHPSLTGVLHNATIYVANGFIQFQRLHSPEFTSVVHQTSQILELHLFNSQLSHQLFSW